MFAHFRSSGYNAQCVIVMAFGIGPIYVAKCETHFVFKQDLTKLPSTEHLIWQ